MAVLETRPWSAPHITRWEVEALVVGVCLAVLLVVGLGSALVLALVG